MRPLPTARGLLLALVLAGQPLVAQDRAPQNDSIQQADLKADLFFLAHDLTEGRLVGTRGYALAAEFVKSRFERLGLTPAGEQGSYFHAVQPDGGDARRGEYAARSCTAASRCSCSEDRITIRIASAPAAA